MGIEHRLHCLYMKTWFIKLHLQGKHSFILKVGDPLCLKGAKSGPLDQSTQDKHPFLPISSSSNLQTVWQRWPDVEHGQFGVRIQHTNDETFSTTLVFKRSRLFFLMVLQQKGNQFFSWMTVQITIKLEPQSDGQLNRNWWITGPG